ISEKARVELEKALRIHPLYMEAHLQMGNIYVYQKDYEGAIERYQYILNHMPDDEDAFANLQIALRERGRQIAMNSGNIPLAKEYLNRSLGMKPDDTEALMLVGMAEGSLGNTEAAIRLFERAIQIKPDHAQAYFNMGITFQRAGQLQKAEAMFAQAQKLDPRIFEKNQTGK
ncbi:MAG TPA: tetratricopeptide repeat protein, partial [Saprospiraceae bacterium]|nr:tetratricopeptide repeat protein [Saprospiraceae bacterium]